MKTSAELKCRSINHQQLYDLINNKNIVGWIRLTDHWELFKISIKKNTQNSDNYNFFMEEIFCRRKSNHKFKFSWSLYAAADVFNNGCMYLITHPNTTKFVNFKEFL